MKDGIDHINIYSRAETELGRMLSNFYETPIETPDGRFNSVEGYWYWLCISESGKEALRILSGSEAKKLGQRLCKKERNDDPLFKLKICQVLISKLIGSPVLLELLRNSKPPFKHYYMYEGRKVEPNNCKWLLDIWELLRIIVKNKNETVQFIDLQKFSMIKDEPDCFE